MFPYLFPDLFILPVSFCYSDVYVTTFFCQWQRRLEFVHQNDEHI